MKLVQYLCVGTAYNRRNGYFLFTANANHYIVHLSIRGSVVLLGMIRILIRMSNFLSYFFNCEQITYIICYVNLYSYF
jgi:hypothetical protein